MARTPIWEFAPVLECALQDQSPGEKDGPYGPALVGCSDSPAMCTAETPSQILNSFCGHRPTAANHRYVMSFWKQFKPKSCSVDLKASEKDGILAEIVANMVKSGVLDEDLHESALRTLREREQLASTGVGMAVAVPHVKLSGLRKVVCTLSVHKKGVEWVALDGEPVNLFFTVLRPDQAGESHDPQLHLEMMGWIARLSREADFRAFAKVVKTKTELVDLLKEMSAV